MPLNSKPKPTKPASGSLVPVGPRHVVPKNPKVQGKRQPDEKPTTSRALVLRNGKYGARGTGEVFLMRKMSGREKMDLLAEDLAKQSKQALMTPFRLEKCLKIAESQCDAYVDDIVNLQDPELFRQLIESELEARKEPRRSDVRKNPSYVAKVVGTRIHNAYMLASAWNIVSDTLNGFAIDGLTDKNIKTKLKNDEDMRERYLALYDMVNILVNMCQVKFSVLATTAPHYAKYFKLKPTESTDPEESEYIFDWTDLRGATESFLDSIIIELCFPRAPYPKAVLYQILHDVIEESPHDAKRFPQSLWDAVGDLSVSVELQQLLEAPLFGSDGEAWKKDARQMPEEYENWIDAQIYSQQASNSISFKDLIFPLEKTRHKTVLDAMWKNINLTYEAVSGHDINTLWQLQDCLDYAPQWTSYFMPSLGKDSDDEDGPPALAPASSRRKTSRRLAITAGNGGSDGNADSACSMPGLQSVSNTSDDDGDDDSDDDYDHEDESHDANDYPDSGYNTDEEDELREMLKEAKVFAREGDFFDSGDNIPPEIDPFLQEDRKGNPFLKLLGSLRGRMFSSSPKLKTTTRTEPRPGGFRGAFRATPKGVPKSVPTTMPPKPKPQVPSTTASAPPPKSQKATVEDVEDEDVAVSVSRKKKKKKPKKKKTETSGALPSESAQSTQPMSAQTSTAPVVLASPTKAPSVVSSTSPTIPAYMSTASLVPGAEPETAQSAHSYLQSLSISDKEKVKSRPDHASLFSNPYTEKKGFFSNMSLTKGKDKETAMKEARQSWFSKLTKKTETLMHQLMGTEENEKIGASLKWESFLKIMREMGFEYDPSTAGSSVRFDPPNKNDKPITFHKPHPDPTLTRAMVKTFAKKLKRQYGWTDEDLITKAANS